MKTTLVIDDEVIARLEAEAARRGCTLSELVEATLRRMLDAKAPPDPLDQIASARMGPPRVDVSDRDALAGTLEDK